MTNKDKQLLLLLKDLCARLPYGVKVSFRGKTEVLHEAHIYQSVQTIVGEAGILYDVDTPNIKPYLRPLLSMTEEEKEEQSKIVMLSMSCSLGNSESATTMLNDWLLSKHFDVRGLISKGLALEAPEGMYK